MRSLRFSTLAFVLLASVISAGTAVARGGEEQIAGISISPAVAHQGDFLTNPDCPKGTTGYVNAESSARAACRAGILARGYTHQYVSVTSKIKNWYTDVDGFEARLQELVDAGIQPVVFLTSDTGSWRNQSISAINAELSAFIPQIDHLVGSYVLGIEIDEYWSKDKAQAIGDHLQSLTNKKIGAHQLPDKWDYCEGYSWCDFMVLQYGFGKSAAQIETLTREAITDLGKPVVAGEYNVDGPESLSVTLGDAAVAAGAVGFGNGGTAGP